MGSGTGRAAAFETGLDAEHRAAGGAAIGSVPYARLWRRLRFWAAATAGSGGGFLRQAAATAAGVVGGSLLFQGISSMFGPHYGGGFLDGTPMQPGLSETVINNYYNDPGTTADAAQTSRRHARNTRLGWLSSQRRTGRPPTTQSDHIRK